MSETASARSERVDLRMTPTAKRTLQRAAALKEKTLSEFLLVSLALGGLGAAAGHLAARPARVALLPLLWLPCSGLLDRAHLYTLPLCGHVALACLWTALLLALLPRLSSSR